MAARWNAPLRSSPRTFPPRTEELKTHMDKKTLIENLNHDLAEELSAVIQYTTLSLIHI